MHQYSFGEYLDEWSDIDQDERPHPLDEKPELSDYQLERLKDLRFGIKKDRDKYFVDNLYDELDVDGVPKSFWLDYHEMDREADSTDDYAQSTLEEYATERQV